MRIRYYETKSVTLIADQRDSDYAPLVGEFVVIRPDGNINGVDTDWDVLYKVLTVVYAMPSCLHIEVEPFVDGGNILAAFADASGADQPLSPYIHDD